MLNNAENTLFIGTNEGTVKVFDLNCNDIIGEMKPFRSDIGSNVILRLIIFRTYRKEALCFRYRGSRKRNFSQQLGRSNQHGLPIHFLKKGNYFFKTIDKIIYFQNSFNKREYYKKFVNFSKKTFCFTKISSQKKSCIS